MTADPFSRDKSMNRQERRAKAATETAAHHWLIAGKILFQNQEGAQSEIDLNAIQTTTNQFFASPDIGKAQQQLQLHFFQKMNDAQLVVVDVFVYAINYLGYMTGTEFIPPEKEEPVVKTEVDPFKADAIVN